MFGDITGIGEKGMDRLSGCGMWWLCPKSSGCDGVGTCGAHVIDFDEIGDESVAVVLVVLSEMMVDSGISAGWRCLFWTNTVGHTRHTWIVSCAHRLYFPSRSL